MVLLLIGIKRYKIQYITYFINMKLIYYTIENLSSSMILLTNLQKRTLIKCIYKLILILCLLYII